MINFISNWCFYYLLWSMSSVRFVMNISTNILSENILQNQFEIEGRILSSYGSVRSENSTTSRNIFAIEYFEQDWNRPFKMNSRLCTFAFTLINQNQSDETMGSDTLTQDDIVRNQYSYLPYPAVSKRNLAGELQHYKNKRNATLYNIIPAFTLESLNHYLYQGRNDFKYVAESSMRNLKQNVHSLIFNVH